MLEDFVHATFYPLVQKKLIHFKSIIEKQNHEDNFKKLNEFIITT